MAIDSTERQLSGIPTLLCALLVLFLLTPSAHAVNLIVNGSFDASGTAIGGFASACSQTSQMANCPWFPGVTATKWSVQILTGNGQIDCIVPGSAGAGTRICTPGDPPSTHDAANSPHPNQYFFSLYQTPGPSPDGGNYFLADGGTSFSGKLTQTITGLTVGQLYKLTFWQASAQENCQADDGSPCDPPGNANLTQDWQVTFGSTMLTSTVMSTPIHTSVGWNQQVMMFVAQASSQVLQFYAQGTPDSAPPIVLLDGVDLEAAPEPDSSVLMGLGLVGLWLGIGALQRRRKRANMTTDPAGPPD